MKKIKYLGIILFVLFILTGCAGNNKKVFESVYNYLEKNDSSYAKYKDQMKDYYSYNEKLDGNKIIVELTELTENKTSSYEYALDGDYIVFDLKSEEDFGGLYLLFYLADGIANYYGMDERLVSTYINTLASQKLESKYFIYPKDENETLYKLYVAGKYDMKELDEMYIDETVLSNSDELDENYVSNYMSAGKIILNSSASVNDGKFYIGEYGDKNTDLTYKSIIAIMNKLKPKGYLKFVEGFTKLEDTKIDKYVVSTNVSKDDLSEYFEEELINKYKFVKISFGN